MTGDPHRLHHVDALRGFALLGILAVNIWSFADPWFGSVLSNPHWNAPADRAVRFAVALLFEAKFYLLFSFLFGLSFTLQHAAADRAATDFAARMRRRQAGLILLGTLHGLLLFDGDILLLYGMLGLVLLAAAHWPPRRMLAVAAVLVGVAGASWLVFALALARAGAVAAGGDGDAFARLAAYDAGALATLRHTAAQWPQTQAGVALLQAPNALAMFLAGCAAGRLGWLGDGIPVLPALRRVVPVALPAGIAGAVTYAWTTTLQPGIVPEIAGIGIMMLTAPLLSMSYAAAVLAWWQRSAGGAVAGLLAPMGRMALSNYLGQSLLMAIVFTGYGFGLANRLAPAAVLALVPLIIVAQGFLSRRWLRRHAYGPAEWLLRALTIGRLPPWRARRSAAAAVTSGWSA